MVIILLWQVLNSRHYVIPFKNIYIYIMFFIERIYINSTFEWWDCR